MPLQLVWSALHEFRHTPPMPEKTWKTPLSTECTAEGRVCTQCGIFRPWSEYQKHKGHSLKRQPRCRSCANAANKAYYQRNREQIIERTHAYNKTERRRAYMRKYAREWLRRYNEARAVRPRPEICEVCGGTGGEKGIVFDHDHKTGNFRGWLCSHCNRALGLLQEDPATLRTLADYIEKHRCQSVA